VIFFGVLSLVAGLIVNDANVEDDEDVADIIPTGCVSFPFLCKQASFFLRSFREALSPLLVARLTLGIILAEEG